MGKKFLVFIMAILAFSLTQGQQVESKKCRACGKPLKECPHHGRHPQQQDNNGTSQQKPPTKPTAKEGSIYISSTPSGAVVKLDGQYMGETPLTVGKQNTGSHTVTFSKEGYESVTKTVSVTAGKKAECTVTLKKKASQQQQSAQQQTGQSSSLASTQTFTANGVSFKMIKVEGGSTGTFYIGETEVTQALWQAVMGSNPSSFKGSNRPVENVSWDDCKEFIRKLNALTGQTFRLPKEAEWEYAAKGGNKSRGYTYSGCNSEDELELYAWYDKNAYYCGSSSGNSSHPDYGTHSVKTRRANELGIYDMSGNVWEWCEDLYSSSGVRRVGRGGSWSINAEGCRVSGRGNLGPSYRYNFLGFRLAR